ncbi:hypothetical protein V1523DRAFT_398532 [Lipomyces doorenjongii]
MGSGFTRHLSSTTTPSIFNKNSDKLHPAEVVHTYNQSCRGLTEKLKCEARQASREKYHCKIKDDYKKYNSQLPQPAECLRHSSKVVTSLIKKRSSPRLFLKYFSAARRSPSRKTVTTGRWTIPEHP